MPLRDDYAMFCYGIKVNGDDDEDAYNIAESNKMYNLEVQSIGDDTYIVYVKGTDITVGSRTGSFISKFDISNQYQKIIINYKNEIYDFSWILVMWGPPGY